MAGVSNLRSKTNFTAGRIDWDRSVTDVRNTTVAVANSDAADLVFEPSRACRLKAPDFFPYNTNSRYSTKIIMYYSSCC